MNHSASDTPGRPWFYKVLQNFFVGVTDRTRYYTSGGGSTLRYSISDIVMAVKVPFRSLVHRGNLHVYHDLAAKAGTPHKGPYEHGELFCNAEIS